MKIITLSGPGNSGKTTTLKELYKKLCSICDGIIEEPKVCANSSADEEYFIRYKGKKVAIVTMGDIPLEMIWHFGIYCQKGADILIIANSNKTWPLFFIGWHKECLMHYKNILIESDINSSLQKLITALDAAAK